MSTRAGLHAVNDSRHCQVARQEVITGIKLSVRLPSWKKGRYQGVIWARERASRGNWLAYGLFNILRLS